MSSSAVASAGNCNDASLPPEETPLKCNPCPRIHHWTCSPCPRIHRWTCSQRCSHRCRNAKYLHLQTCFLTAPTASARGPARADDCKFEPKLRMTGCLLREGKSQLAPICGLTGRLCGLTGPPSGVIETLCGLTGGPARSDCAPDWASMWSDWGPRWSDWPLGHLTGPSAV